MAQPTTRNLISKSSDDLSSLSSDSESICASLASIIIYIEYQQGIIFSITLSPVLESDQKWRSMF